MKKKHAKALVELLKAEPAIEKLTQEDIKEHRYTKTISFLGAFRHRLGEDVLDFLVCSNWSKDAPDDCYLVAYRGKNTVLEIHVDKEDSLWWAYRPIKQDGGNAERKARFESIFGAAEVELRLPRILRDVAPFIERVRSIKNTRIYADNLVPSLPCEAILSVPEIESLAHAAEALPFSERKKLSGNSSPI